MTVTAQNWIDECRYHLLGGQIEMRNQLANAYTAGSGQLTFQYPVTQPTNAISAGNMVEVGTTLFYVWSVNQTTQQATVQVVESSVDGNYPAGQMTTTNPRFPQYRILAMLNDELASLCSGTNGLWSPQTYEFPYIAVEMGYDLPTSPYSLLDVYDVRYNVPGPSEAWPRIPSTQYRVELTANTSDFPSGQSITLMRGGYPGFNVRVYYKAAFAPLASATSDVSTSGLPASAYDIPPLGAAYRMVSGREIKRNLLESQGETRRTAEVPAGALLRSPMQVQSLWQRRVSEEAAKLNRLWPVRRW